MSKVILCFVHKNPKQINLFIEQLLCDSKDETDIFLHIDKNHDEIRAEIFTNDHVFFIRENVAITWGNDSMIDALLASFSEITNYYKNYEYFLICTGQDLLVKSGIDDYLESNKGKLFLDFFPEDSFRRKMLTHRFPAFMCKYLGRRTNPLRILRSMYVRLIRKGVIPERRVRYNISGITFYKSFNWCAIPYDAFLYIVNFLSENPGFIDLYHGTYLPEDGFLGTILLNSPYKDSVVKNNDGTGVSLTFWSSIKDQHMVTLTAEHRNEIDASICFFARKFDTEIDSKIVETYYKSIVKSKEELS